MAQNGFGRFLTNLFSPAQNRVAEATPKNERRMVAGVEIEMPEQLSSFNNTSITYTGEIEGFNYTKILKDKQNNIIDIYKLADYFSYADPIIHGVLYNIYAPFTTSKNWYLTGVKEKTARIYEQYYKSIRMQELLDAIALEGWKYGNVFIYVRDGIPFILPVHLCKIGNVAVNGEPVVDFNCSALTNAFKAKTYSVKEEKIKDGILETMIKGYPPEIGKAIKNGEEYAQLNPERCKTYQGVKEGWQRYAIPFIVACLQPLTQKAMIQKFEGALLNLGIRSFVHASYGDPKSQQEMYPVLEDLAVVGSITSKAMKGFPLAVTNHLVNYKVIQPDTDSLFQHDKYKTVNEDILTACGVSPVVLNGTSAEGSTFASAQVSMQTLLRRITSARSEIEQLMTKINYLIKDELSKTFKYNIEQVPEFRFKPMSMDEEKALRDSCLELWKSGVVSSRTLTEINGFSYDRERETMEQDNDTLAEREASKALNTTKEHEKVGRPALEDEERSSDKTTTGNQPKPSNPEGSMQDE